MAWLLSRTPIDIPNPQDRGREGRRAGRSVWAAFLHSPSVLSASPGPVWSLLLCECGGREACCACNSLPPSLPPFFSMYHYPAFMGPTTLLTATLSPVTGEEKERKGTRE